MRRAAFLVTAATSAGTRCALPVVPALVSAPHLSTPTRAREGVSYATLATPSRGYSTHTRILRFDIRKHEMEKRRLRELEKAGIDPNDDDDAPWVAPEEQQRLDEEEQARLAEEEARRQEFLAKRAEEDALKRKKFKEFRAKQIAMSRQRKETVAEQKASHKERRAQDRVVVEGGDAGAVEGAEETSAEEGEEAQQPTAQDTSNADMRGK